MNSAPDPEPRVSRLRQTSAGLTGRLELGMAGSLADGLLIWQMPWFRLVIGWSCVVMALVVTLGAWWLGQRPGNSDIPSMAMLGILFAATGVTFQSACHLFLCRLNGTLPVVMVFTAVGYRVFPDGFLGRWAWENGAAATVHRRLARSRILELLLPSIALILAACVAMALDRVWQSGLQVITSVAQANTSPGLAGMEVRMLSNSPAYIAGWIWAIQALWMLLPIPGSHGRAIMECGCALVGGWFGQDFSVLALARRVNFLQGILAIVIVATGIVLWRVETATFAIPAWPFVTLLGLLVWGARRPVVFGPRMRGVGRPKIENGQPTNTKRQKGRISFWGRLRVRRARRMERAELRDEVQLDGILDKLHAKGHKSLTAAERGVLDRVSKRYNKSKQNDKTKQ